MPLRFSASTVHLQTDWILKNVPDSVAKLDAHPTGDHDVAGSTPAGSQHSFVEI